MQQITQAENPRAQAREHLNTAARQLIEIAREFPDYRESFVVLARCAGEPLTVEQLAEVGRTLKDAQGVAADRDPMVAAGLDPILAHLRQAYTLAR